MIYGKKGCLQLIAVVRSHLRMLQCAPSNQTLVYLAAFSMAETSVCGQSGSSPTFEKSAAK
jgi:hypothetical protein